MRRSLVLVALAAIALAACGIQVPRLGAPEGGGSLTCGDGPSFSADVLEGGGGAEKGADPAAEALRRHLGTNDTEIDFLPAAGWIEVSRTDASGSTDRRCRRATPRSVRTSRCARERTRAAGPVESPGPTSSRRTASA
jgi:hypothetical protein